MNGKTTTNYIEFYKLLIYWIRHQKICVLWRDKLRYDENKLTNKRNYWDIWLAPDWNSRVRVCVCALTRCARCTTNNWLREKLMLCAKHCKTRRKFLQDECGEYERIACASLCDTKSTFVVGRVKASAVRESSHKIHRIRIECWDLLGSKVKFVIWFPHSLYSENVHHRFKIAKNQAKFHKLIVVTLVQLNPFCHHLWPSNNTKQVKSNVNNMFKSELFSTQL